MATWTYLIQHHSTGNSVGNAVVTRPRPIDSADEVVDVEVWLRRNGITGAVLTNVVLLKRRRFAKWEDRGTLVTGADSPGVATGVDQSKIHST